MIQASRRMKDKKHAITNANISRQGIFEQSDEKYNK